MAGKYPKQTRFVPDGVGTVAADAVQPPRDRVMRTAILSEDQKYRYLLGRRWQEGIGSVTFVMLNPSTADHVVDDRTIKRCMDFARSWGHSGLEVVNLYAFRATDPDELGKQADPVGPLNDK